MRPLALSFLLCLTALCALAHLPGPAEDQCVTNADCLRRRLPLLKPRRLHQVGVSPERRAFDPITIDAQCSSTTPTPTTQTLQPGIYEITVTGARGGASIVTAGVAPMGGRGAKIAATYNITNVVTLNILVGCSGAVGFGGGGGGGSFIAVGKVPFVIAGGGGGANFQTSGRDVAATYTTTGGASPDDVPAQTDPGQGGKALSSSNSYAGGGGGGFLGDGQNPSAADGPTTGGKAYLNVGNGGSGSFAQSSTGRGGTGGGGGGNSGGSGGGGGYTGGAGGGRSSETGGGGGSFYDQNSQATSAYAVFFQAIYSVAGTGNGQVIIQRTS